MRRHELDPLSLAFGLMFTAAGALFMSANLNFTDLKGEWLWPVPLVIVGVVMLISALGRRDEPAPVAEEQPIERETPADSSEPERDEML